jgi:hypothetical protein
VSRGTPSGLRWVVETVERTDRPRYRYFYPWHVTGRIIDEGTDHGHFGWQVPDLADPAYVPAPGVEIPAEARTPNPYTPRKRGTA